MPDLLGSTIPIPVKKHKVVFSSSTTVIAAGSTTYLYAVAEAGEYLGGINATEAYPVVTFLVTRTGFLRNLLVKSNAAPGVGESNVFTVRVNGINTAIIATISGLALNSGDLVNSIRVVVGDRITLRFVNSAAAVATSHAASFDYEVNAIRIAFDYVGFGTFLTVLPAGQTKYFASTYKSGGVSGGVSTVSGPAQSHLIVRKGSLMNLVVLAGVAPGVGQTFVYTIQVNGVNTSLTVTLTGAVAVIGIDATDVVSVNPGNGVSLKGVASVGATTTIHGVILDFEEGDYRAG